MVLANRNLRLGHAATAAEQTRIALDSPLEPSHREQCMVVRVQALWLSGNRAGAADALDQLENKSGLSLPTQKEARWQRMVLDLIASGDPKPMLKAIRSGERFHAAGYIIECCLWAFVLPSRRHLARLPSTAYLRRNSGMRAVKQGAFFRCAETLQQAYDVAIPLTTRIRMLEARLAERTRLVTIDKELLLWAGALRWLLRTHAEQTARFVQLEYEALCLRLSRGGSRDVLGFFNRP